MLYSIVIPAYNESANLKQLVHEICSVMYQLEELFEIIIIDDASTDNTFQMLSTLKKELPQLRAIRLTTREGQSAALSIGFKEAQGSLIIMLDGDGQNNPEDIPTLIQALNGHDCVTGWRISRQDSWTKRIWSKLANSLRRFLLRDSIHDTGCALKICTASSLRSIPYFKGMHRFIASLLIIYGFSVREIPVSHRPRLKGKSNYSLFNRGFCSMHDLLGVLWLKKRRIKASIAQRLL